MQIGFHASHEQFSPRHLLELVKLAENAGFEAVLSSDHFHPWGSAQGESGFAWSWLGAAMQATQLDFAIVNAPGQRYHPAIIAQAVATLDEMFPGRFFIAVGSGQALNENITGGQWPSKEMRNERLKESAAVMRELWQGGYVTRDGIVKIEKAKLFTKPVSDPIVYGAALTEETAQWLTGWADGMITVSKPMEQLEKMAAAFKKNAPGKPMALKVQVSYDPSEEAALEGAWEQWKNNIFPSSLLSEINTPEQFDALGASVRKEDIKEHVIISSDPEVYIEKIKAFSAMGFKKIYMHNVNRQQEKFIKFFGTQVLPHFKNMGNNNVSR
ncbi:MAG TPA: TIGR03885 family FMN-dependent LLM class oxidoreductase [Flavobacterium sp.]|nr:TIGR03885 family FMN-dependent LLM class oxidoreductase [Flavobacterium sp.]